MRKLTKIIAISAFSLMVLALPSVASAQWSGGYPNGGNYPNGRYNPRYGGNLERAAKRLEDRSKDFERIVDREFDNNGRYRNGGGILGRILDNGRYGNRGYNDNYIKRLAEDFRKAANDFENRVDDRGRDMYRGQEAANRMLNIASQIDRELGRFGQYGGRSGMHYQWTAIRNDLNIVANAYGYGNYNNRGPINRNGRYPY